MPIPIPTNPDPPLFPCLTVDQIDAARLSAWYETFQDLTIPSTIIDLEELGEKDAFIQWLDSESIFMPLETSGDEGEGEGSIPRHYLPKLGAKIREVISVYGGGVFPKLNWTAPRDAAFLLPQTSDGPLHCTSPENIYLLLKSSDFLTHAITPERVYEGCDNIPVKGEMKLELILRKYESSRINPSREFRCFVRNDILLASVRDFNYYPHFQDAQVLERVQETLRSFFEDEIMGDYAGGSDYTFDIILDETHSNPILLDFNPYNHSSDPLLFTYEELHALLLEALLPPSETTRPRLPIIRVIDSQSHPEANRGMPAFGSNMMPVEVVEMSQGRGVGEFKDAWERLVRQGMEAEGSESESGDE